MIWIWLLLSVAAADHPEVDCDRCHDASGWVNVRFDHETTRLPLRGRHAAAPCRACHAELRRLKMDSRCGSCHRDPHAGRLGNLCDRCHDTMTFASGRGVAAHRRTRFPLIGRHGVIPCEQCHPARADRTYGDLAVRCEACHANAVLRTAGGGLDHVAIGITSGCERCHVPVAWRRASMAEHDRCFPIHSGKHRGIACRDCHTSLSGLQVQTCSSFTAACTRCHSCAQTDGEHRDGGNVVAGYQCADRKCYECHPQGEQ